MDHHNIASTLSWHGLRAESAYVLRMGEQRAELLEALKKFVAESEDHAVIGGDVVLATCESREAAITAITRAEAAE